MEAVLYTTDGKVKGNVQLPDEIFGSKVNRHVLYEYIKLYLNNQRHGTNNVKGRSEVSCSTRKIYKQKGTGRARHGAASAPQFVKGGKAHGAKPRVFYTKIAKQIKDNSVISAFSQRAKEGKISIVDSLVMSKISTKELNTIVRALCPEGRILLIVDEYNETNRNIYLSGRNIPYLETKVIRDVNAYDIMKSKNIIMKLEVANLITAQEVGDE